MTNLSTEQEELKASIKKSAGIWGGIFGLATAGISYWALGGQSGGVQIGGAVAAGAVVAAGISKWRVGANSAAAKCGSCNAAFSITRTDHIETVTGSETKETRDAQPDFSTKVVTWVEDKIDVTDTYTCAKCSDATTKNYTKTSKRDEVETIEPAPVKDKPKAETKDEGGFFSSAPVKDGGLKAPQKGTDPAPVDGVATSTLRKGKDGGMKK